MKQENFSGKIAIVDIGWFGNLQNALIKICNSAGIKVDICGYYVGIRQECAYFDVQKMKGYLFYKDKNVKYQQIEGKCTAVIEALFSKSEGTTVGFKRQEDRIMPILADCVRISEKKYRLVEEVQDAAILRLKYLESIKCIEITDFKAEDYFYGILKIGLMPSLRDAVKMGGFIEDVEMHGTIYYIFHPLRIRKDIHERQWKLGFLKRVLKLKMNYIDIYNMLEKI